jgi:hypothetical protein
MRRPARRAPRPPRTDRHREPPRREHPAPDRVTPAAQPPAAPGTRKKAVTEKLLRNRRAVAYREHWCLRAPHGPPRGFGKRTRGGPALIRCAHGVAAHHPPATGTTTKTTLTSNDTLAQMTLTLNGG